MQKRQNSGCKISLQLNLCFWKINWILPVARDFLHVMYSSGADSTDFEGCHRITNLSATDTVVGLSFDWILYKL